jgi:DNA-binding transcriptional ArsR family regulator
MLRRVCAIEQTCGKGAPWTKRFTASRAYAVSWGNPIAVVDALSQSKELTPSEIAHAVGRSVSRVSHVLASLRLAEIVRYDTDGRHARYRLKHPRETREFLKALAMFIDSSSAFQ